MFSKFQRRDAETKGESKMPDATKPTAATAPAQVAPAEPVNEAVETPNELGSNPVAPQGVEQSEEIEANGGESGVGEDSTGDEEFEGEFDPERALNTIKKFREREKLREKKEKELARKLGEVAGQLKNANQKILSFEEQQAAKQQQFEELAIERGTKIQELEQSLAQAKFDLEGRLQETSAKTETLTNEVHKLVDDEVRGWPEKVRGLVPKRTEASAETRLDRMRAAREVALDLMKVNAEPIPGNAPISNGSSQQNRQPDNRTARSNRIYDVI